MKKRFFFLLIISLFIFAGKVFAAGDSAAHGIEPTVLIGVAGILLLAGLFGEICEKFNQPAVIGEIVAGIVLGNLALVGFHYADSLKTNLIIEALAQIGIIILLFEVGLETHLKDMVKVGKSAFLVAAIGVIVPFFLGWLVAYLFVPTNPTLSHIFIGAILCATSIGITARVLRDLGRLNERVAQIILGAAVIDDVLALLLLGIVDGAIEASANGTSLAILDFAFIAFKAIGFLVAAIAVGQFLAPRIFKSVKHFESRSIVIAISIAICFLTAYLATLVDLAAIIGAFAAGLILDEVHFEELADQDFYQLENFLAPVSALLAPIFFVTVGMKVDLQAFGQPSLLLFAFSLTLAAIIGKQVCSFGVLESDINKKAVGFGMIPRGEVVLFFASFGTTIFLPTATGVPAPIINSGTFSSIVIMVMITTLIAPFLLKWAMGDKVKTLKTESPDRA